jgi:cytidyltransferase-like protein
MIETDVTLFAREWTTDLSDFEPYIKFEDEETLLEKKRNLQRFKEERVPGQDNIGLVVGRFQPPHAGHFYLIEAALEVAETAIVGIGSANARNEDNPFTALRRELILRNELKTKGLEHRVSFVYLNDYDDDKKWCEKTLEQAQQRGKVDVIVGNNGWVNNIFRDRGYRALEIPELKRTSFQGKVVRADMRSKGLLRPFGR